MNKTARHPSANKWKWAKRLLTLAFFVLVALLLLMLIRNLDWQEVRHALQSYRASTLAMGAVIAFVSYGVFSSYDLLGRRYTQHTLAARKILPLAFVCYAFNLNLSTWVGGVALRYRLYSKMGLDVATITRILTFGLITNWLGYLLVAGTVFALGFPQLPGSFNVGASGLRWIGVLLVLVAVLYLAACRFAKRRTWTLRRQSITLPSFKLAALQATLGTTNWCLMAALIYLLLPDKAAYPSILATLLISSIAGVITHIPAGLGVLETVFITLQQGVYSKGTLLAALIGYRVLYFLVPLAVACVVYLMLERRNRGANARQTDQPS